MKDNEQEEGMEELEAVDSRQLILDLRAMASGLRSATGVTGSTPMGNRILNSIADQIEHTIDENIAETRISS